MQLKLKPYQETSVQYGVNHPYCILALSPGLGKTPISLTIASRLKSKTLVVCPSYLIFNWVAEIKKFYPEKIITVFKASKDIYKVWDSDIVIMPYGLLGASEVLFEWADMVICDEATYLKEMKSKRSEDFHRLIYENSVERCLLLTGTPIQNRVYELYSLMAICNYRPQLEESAFLKLFPTYVDFANHFSYKKEYNVKTKRGYKSVVSWEGHRNIEELKNKYLKDIYIRFKAEDVLDQIGEPIVKEVLVSDSVDEKLLAAFNKFNQENTSTAPDIKAQAALNKVPFTIQYTKELLQMTDKVVVYTDHVASCEALAKELGVKPIHGGTSIEDRRRIAEAFMYKDAKVLVATIGAFSTGVNLVMSHHMVFNDYPWVPGMLEQAKKRIDRIGQNNLCVYHMILGSSQDYYILKKIESKTKTILAVT